MSVTVELIAKHSGAKDHLAMTGGTLSADKLVRGDAPLVLQQSFFPVAVIDQGAGDAALTRLYSGIHSIEHALASPEGGDLRARLDEFAGESGVGRRLVDMSPYVPGLVDVDADAKAEAEADTDGEAASRLVIGFRSTFVSDGELLARGVFAEAYDRALRQIRLLLAGGGAVPFSTPEQCGQYNLHSAAAAVELIDGAQAEGAGGAVGASGTVEVEVGAREMYVCDLRLVKPRLPDAFSQRVLDVLGGHVISQEVERSAWRYLPAGDARTIAAGNFGCSTGEYLMVGNPGGVDRESLLRGAHVAVGRALVDVAAYEGDDALRRRAADDARFALGHIERHAGGVWSEIEKGR